MSAAPQVYQIKKYPNRRFYDTTRSRHVTQDELFRLVQQGNSIQVTDSNSGADITNQVLAQMILERDPPKLDLFPAGLLHQVIQANQQILHSFLERYFNRPLDAFLQSQQQFESYLRQAGVPEPNLMPLQWARSLMPNLGGNQNENGSAVDPGSAGSDHAPMDMSDESEDSDGDSNTSAAELLEQIEAMKRRLEQLESEGGGRKTTKRTTAKSVKTRKR